MISCDIKVNVYATAKSYMTFNIYTLFKLDPTSCLPMTFKHILLDILFLCDFYYSVCSCLGNRLPAYMPLNNQSISQTTCIIIAHYHINQISIKNGHTNEIILHENKCLVYQAVFESLCECVVLCTSSLMCMCCSSWQRETRDENSGRRLQGDVCILRPMWQATATVPGCRKGNLNPSSLLPHA